MLQKGDIIYIQKGYAVTVLDIPEIYYRDSHPFSKKLTQGRTKIGIPKPANVDVTALREEIKKLIKFTFAYNQVPLDLSILERFVNHQVPILSAEDYLIPEGEYIVTEVRQVSTFHNAICQSYKHLPLRKIEIDADCERLSDRGLIKVVGQDLGFGS